MGVSVDESVDALGLLSGRFTTLLRSGLPADRAVTGLDWTVRELGAHLASGAIAYGEMTVGGASPYRSIEARATTNRERIADEANDDLDALAATIDREVASMTPRLKALRETDEMPWHGGITLPATAFIGAMVAEFMFHGLDLARTAGADWPLDRSDARSAIDFFNAATPYVVDTTAAKGVTAAFDVRYRGYEPATFRFDDGALTVTPGRAERADVRLSVDPVAFLMLGYRRTTLPKVLASGRAVAWGRRPWLAFRFAGLFEAP